MKLFLIIILGVAIVAAKNVKTAKTSQVLKEFSDGNAQYIGKLYKELAITKPGSFLVSPLSLQTIFALISGGAKGNTQKQIVDSLHIPEGEAKIKETFLRLSENLQTNDKYTLKSANKIYLANYFEIEGYFKNAAVDVFNAEIENINFAESDNAAAKMNKWVEDKTYHKIRNLIKADSLDSTTIAVMINALYFQGTWVKEFATFPSFPFRVNKNRNVYMDMMSIYDNFSCYRSNELHAQFLELPYKGEEITMTFVLPNHFDKLSELEERIADVLVAPKYQIEPVEAIIPKFKIESTTPFIPILQKLGITDAFTGLADFSGIADGITISEVLQKTFIEVDEKGTTAAAATEVSFDRISGGNGFRFIANHPFLFYLKHKSLGVFFIGRYSGPEGV